MNTLDLLGVITAGEVEARSAEVVSGDLLKDAGLLTSDVVFGYVRAWKGTRRAGVHELYESLWIGIDEGLEQDGVDDREDGGIDADANRDDEDGDDRETGSFGEGAEAEAEVADDVFEPWKGAIAPDLLTCGWRVTEPEASLAARFFRGETTCSVSMPLMGKVGGDLFGEVGVFLLAVHEVA